ncbi:MAG: phosphoesterase, partial [Desulfovibrionales bacterium]|nr:phosphoesterase [Desulfovibrionales bacterium]
MKIFDKTDRVLIVISADPDSIASALAMKRLLWRRVQGVTIAHNNEIKRLDNLAMVRLLNVPLQRLQTLAPETFTRKIMLDSQPYHNPDFAHIDYDAVIDHHP